MNNFIWQQSLTPSSVMNNNFVRLSLRSYCSTWLIADQSWLCKLSEMVRSAHFSDWCDSLYTYMHYCTRLTRHKAAIVFKVIQLRDLEYTLFMTFSQGNYRNLFIIRYITLYVSLHLISWVYFSDILEVLRSFCSCDTPDYFFSMSCI